MCGKLLIALLERPLDLARSSLVCHILALIVQLFTLAKPKLQLYPAVLKVQRKGDKRQPLLFDLSEQTHYFALVQQKPPYSQRVAVEDVALLIRGNVHTLDPHLAAVDTAPTVFKIYSAAADRLYLCADQLNAALDALQHEIVVASLAVVSYLLCALLINSQISPSLSRVFYYITPFRVCQGFFVILLKP